MLVLICFYFLVEKSKRQSEDSGDTIGALPEKDSGNFKFICICVFKN